MKTGFIDKLIARLDRIDPGSLQSHFLRLAQERGLLETILQAVQEGIIVVTEQGVISYANQAAGKLIGFHADQIPGDPISHYLPDIDWKSIFSMNEKEWSHLLTREIETTYPEHRFIDFYVMPLMLEENKGGGAVVILRDVTRERMNTAQTIESERLQAITLLAAGVAHEIGNPLNSLNIHLQLLDRELESPEEDSTDHLRELVDVARQEVTRLDQIITQFLRALRPAPITPVAIQIGPLLKDTLDFMRQEIQDRGIHVHLNLGEKTPKALGDAAQLRQAFFNLIKNAIQAMNDGGRLHIDISYTERFVALSFKDTGHGFSPENLSHIFEPYNTSKPNGSGLGLMIVQRIIRDHGGEIEVHSEQEHGARITLFIPRADQRIRLLEAHRLTTEGIEHDPA